LTNTEAGVKIYVGLPIFISVKVIFKGFLGRYFILIISNLITNVAILFIMMLPGVILKKCKFCDASLGKGISNLVLYIAQPALIAYAYLSCESSFADIWLSCLITFILSLLVHGIFIGTALLFFRREPEEKQKMLRFVTVFANAAFMGIPLIQSMLGAEAAIYASIYNISFNLFLWTFGVYLCTRHRGEDLDMDGDCDLADEIIALGRSTKGELSVKKVLLHPVTLASVIGILLLAFGVNVELLESSGLTIVSDSLEMLKNLVAPLSMTVIGLRLATLDMKGTLRDAGMYVFLALRHIALPLITVLLIFILKLIGIPVDGMTATVTVILAATPAASSATMFAEKYDCDANYTSRLVVISTILSIATMPLILFITGLIL